MSRPERRRGWCGHAEALAQLEAPGSGAARGAPRGGRPQPHSAPGILRSRLGRWLCQSRGEAREVFRGPWGEEVRRGPESAAEAVRREPRLRRPGLGMAGQRPVPCTESEWLALKWRSRTPREGLLHQRLGLAGQMDVENAQDGEKERGKGRSARKVGADGSREGEAGVGSRCPSGSAGFGRGLGCGRLPAPPRKDCTEACSQSQVPLLDKREKLLCENADIGGLTFKGSPGSGGRAGAAARAAADSEARADTEDC